MKKGDVRSCVVRAIRRVGRLPMNLARNGVVQSLRLASIYFILPWSSRLLALYVRILRRVRPWRQASRIDERIRHLRSRKEQFLAEGEKGYCLRLEDFGYSGEQLSNIKELARDSSEIVLGEIDHDGFFLSHYGHVEGLRLVTKEDYLPRRRFNLHVVARDGSVGVKKIYNGNKVSFANEIDALSQLGKAGCNVPAIMDIDFDNLALTFSFIPGTTLREELAEKGAVLQDRDIANSPAFARLSPERQRLKKIGEGKRFLHYVVDGQFVERLFQQIQKAHERGFALPDIKYGNVIIEKESGEPYMLDFELSDCCADLGKSSFRALRDMDIEEFNLHFDTHYLTRKELRRRLKDRRGPAMAEWYAPAYFESGLWVGQIWHVDSGYGRWHYILKKRLPCFQGKRVLDLGANNGHNLVQMLRHGARSGVAVELDDRFISQGRFVKEAFEWADNTTYDFRYVQGDMRGLPEMDLGTFDLVLALCSIYYLDDESIARLTRHVSEISDVFVLQCNHAKNIDRADPGTYERASVEYAAQTLTRNGFPHTEVFAPFGYPRPLVIGRKARHEGLTK